jgi:hypothetical protein
LCLGLSNERALRGLRFLLKEGNFLLSSPWLFDYWRLIALFFLSLLLLIKLLLSCIFSFLLLSDPLGLFPLLAFLIEAGVLKFLLFAADLVLFFFTLLFLELLLSETHPAHHAKVHIFRNVFYRSARANRVGTDNHWLRCSQWLFNFRISNGGRRRNRLRVLFLMGDD